MSRSDASDAALAWGVRGAAVLAGSAILLVLAFVLRESLPALAPGGAGRFFTDPTWHPSTGSYSLWPMLAGTVTVAAGAMVLAVPLGIASALFVRMYGPRPLARLHRRIVELLAGIPSVVYGFWGLAVLVPIIGRLEPPGTSVLAAALILGVMILPTVALTTDAAIESVDAGQLRAGAALGLTRWTTVRRVVLPAARGGVVTGLILALARALGETMAVLMVAGNVVQVPGDVFAPVRTLTANIALEMSYAMGDHRSALFVSGLLLLLLVGVLVGGAGAAGGRVTRG